MLPAPPPAARLLAAWLACALLLWGGWSLAAPLSDLARTGQADWGPLGVVVVGHAAAVIFSLPCPAPPAACRPRPACPAPPPSALQRLIGC